MNAGPPSRPRRYSRWRAASLCGVYVLFAIHIVHWKLADKTLAPLELNEVMYTLELGIVTAGFLFMVAAVVSVLIFGRFFCSWGCHILALEDLCAWLLRKIGIRPKPVRSRVLLLVPLGAAFYMFLWPQVGRLIEGRSLPRWRVEATNGWWASFVTDDFWRNLPGPWITGLTLFICGFLIVYFLGSRSFCTYACPYGAVFALADRFAPGQIIARGDCSGCGECTAACSTHIRVHEELTAFGRVVSPSCMKDLDCVAACTSGAVRFGFTTPSFFKSWNRKAVQRPRGDFSLLEEVLLAAVFLASLFIFRGLYEAVPFLMSIGIGCILGYVVLLSWRLVRAQNVRLNNFQLKRAGMLTWWGNGFALASYVLWLFVLHSGFVRYHEWRGNETFDSIRLLLHDGREMQAAALVPESIIHLRYCERWGLVTPATLPRQLASLYAMSSTPRAAEPYLRRIMADDPQDREARIRLVDLLMQQDRLEEADRELSALDQLVATNPTNGDDWRTPTALAHRALAEAWSRLGRTDDAERHRARADQLAPDLPRDDQ